MAMMMIIGGLIDRTVFVDLLSCYLEFKYDLSMLLVIYYVCTPPTVSMKFMGFLMAFLQNLLGTEGTVT